MFHAEHLEQIDAQDAQRAWVSGNAEALAASPGTARTLLLDGQPIASAGVVEVWPGRGYAWALLSAEAGRYMVRITRAVREFLDGSGYRRVEMAVDADFAAGRRWAEMLGFVCETPQPMRAYAPNGRDCYLYARVI